MESWKPGRRAIPAAILAVHRRIDEVEILTEDADVEDFLIFWARLPKQIRQRRTELRGKINMQCHIHVLISLWL